MHQNHPTTHVYIYRQHACIYIGGTSSPVLNRYIKDSVNARDKSTNIKKTRIQPTLNKL